MLCTTGFEIAGHRQTRCIGIVRGLTVRTRSLPMSFLGGLATIFGGKSYVFTSLCETTREEAYQLMIKHATAMGANAVIGMRYDTGPMMGAAEVLCYGTAVIVEPNA